MPGEIPEEKKEEKAFTADCIQIGGTRLARPRTNQDRSYVMFDCASVRTNDSSEDYAHLPKLLLVA